MSPDSFSGHRQKLIRGVIQLRRSVARFSGRYSAEQEVLAGIQILKAAFDISFNPLIPFRIDSHDLRNDYKMGTLCQSLGLAFGDFGGGRKTSYYGGGISSQQSSTLIALEVRALARQYGPFLLCIPDQEGGSPCQAYLVENLNAVDSNALAVYGIRPSSGEITNFDFSHENDALLSRAEGVRWIAIAH